MNKSKLAFKIISLGLLVVFLASCAQGSGLSNEELAATYAAQTLAAIPSETPLPSETPEPTETPTATPPLVVYPVGPSDFPENVNPLTGLAVSDTTILDRRPVFFKVANYPVAGRPHAGLSFADMVFEYYIGTGGNRFIALFYGQDSDTIGPVRSGRLIDRQIVSLYEGVIGLVSADVNVLSQIVNTLGNRVISGKNICPGVCDDGRNIVISVFGDSAALTDVATSRGVVNQRYPLDGMLFDPEVPQNGQPADEISVRFSQVNPEEWQYDPDNGLFMRWIDNETGVPIDMIPLVDRNTDEQLAFSNVVVIFVSHTEFAPTLHDMDLTNEIGRRAVVFRDGQAFDLTWSTPRDNQPIQFLDANSDNFPLKPGNTWVVIMGLNTFAVELDGTWTFNFFMP